MAPYYLDIVLVYVVYKKCFFELQTNSVYSYNGLNFKTKALNNIPK